MQLIFEESKITVCAISDLRCSKLFAVHDSGSPAWAWTYCQFSQSPTPRAACSIRLVRLEVSGSVNEAEHVHRVIVNLIE